MIERFAVLFIACLSRGIVMHLITPWHPLQHLLAEVSYIHSFPSLAFIAMTYFAWIIANRDPFREGSLRYDTLPHQPVPFNTSACASPVLIVGWCWGASVVGTLSFKVRIVTLGLCNSKRKNYEVWSHEQKGTVHFSTSLACQCPRFNLMILTLRHIMRKNRHTAR